MLCRSCIFLPTVSCRGVVQTILFTDQSVIDFTTTEVEVST